MDEHDDERTESGELQEHVEATQHPIEKLAQQWKDQV
jgi:hypothetical protein